MWQTPSHRLEPHQATPVSTQWLFRLPNQTSSLDNQAFPRQSESCQLYWLIRFGRIGGICVGRATWVIAAGPGLEKARRILGSVSVTTVSLQLDETRKCARALLHRVRLFRALHSLCGSGKECWFIRLGMDLCVCLIALHEWKREPACEKAPRLYTVVAGLFWRISGGAL